MVLAGLGGGVSVSEVNHFDKESIFLGGGIFL